MDAAGEEPTWLKGVVGNAGRSLITSSSKYIAVVAGPGSGKTFGLQRRVIRLVQGDAVDPTAIFVGTFTRAVTAELRAALAPAAPDGGQSKQPAVSTLHAMALDLLRRNPAATAPGRTFRFLLEHEQDAMLYDVIPGVPIPEGIAKKLDYAADELRKIQSHWAQNLALEDSEFRGAVTRWLEFNGGMLINEVVFLALNALKQGALEKGCFKHVVVDEYQDLTAAEQQMVTELAGDDGTLLVLGDDDQSIYGFRHNHPDGITGFPTQFPGVEKIPIQENRRCGSLIVDLANRMRAEAGPTKAPMISAKGEAGQIDYLHWPTVADEIQGLAEYMRVRTDKKFLVLVPRRLIGYEIRKRIGPDALTSFHEQVLDDPLVRYRFALATLFATPDDLIATRAWLGFDGGGPKFALERNATAFASLKECGKHGLDLLRALDSGEVKPKGTGSKNIIVQAKAALLAVNNAPTNLEELPDYFFGDTLETGYASDAPTDALEFASESLGLLRDAAKRLLEIQKPPSWEKVIENLRYRISTRMPLLDDLPKARVVIMTLHGAKGLEADEIVVAGLADQILPGKERETPEETGANNAEQGRLLYVAVTRAKQHLILSYARQIPQGAAFALGVRQDSGKWGQVFMGPTRFLRGVGLPALVGATWLSKAEREMKDEQEKAAQEVDRDE